MFLNDLFTIKTERLEGNHAEFNIRLNSAHTIYIGHFPNDPITPGVCIVQIAIDLFTHWQKVSYTLIEAKNIKFLNIIKPYEHPEIQYQIDWVEDDNHNQKLKVIVKDGEKVFSKLSFTVRPQ